MIRAVIIDDEQDGVKALGLILKRFCLDVEIVGTANGVASGLKLIEEQQPDIVFLDIQMGDGTGFDLLNAIDEPDFWIIFVTAYDEFALKAFNYNAIDYVLKPVNPIEMVDAVNKVKQTRKIALRSQLASLKQSVETKKMERLALCSKEGIDIVEISSILYAAADGPYTHFYFEGEKKRTTVSRPLKEYDALLNNHEFFRVHQSYLVNLSKITRVITRDNQLELTGGILVDISKRNKEPLMKLLKA